MENRNSHSVKIAKNSPQFSFFSHCDSPTLISRKIKVTGNFVKLNINCRNSFHEIIYIFCYFDGKSCFDYCFFTMCTADYSAKSVSTATKTAIYGFSQNDTLQGLAFLTNFCASSLLKLWKRCATFLVTQRTFWAEKILLSKQKWLFY